MTTEETSSHFIGKKSDGAAYTAMVVDDSEFMISNIKRMLTSFGLDIIGEAHDGEQAVNMYAGLTPKPDVITMDITMPKVNGISATGEIMKQNEDQKIVMVTAIGHQDAVKQAILHGAKHYIVKPFKRENVYNVLKKVLEIS